jgi:hypothetical protein
VRENDVPDYKIASNDVSETTTDYAKTIGQVIGVVAVFALVIAGIYYARKTGAYYQPAIVNNASDSVITSRVDGEFNGWEGETIVTLTNGQIWKQSEYYYYHYAYMPEVTIYRDGARYKMIVKGIEKSVGVDRIN